MADAWMWKSGLAAAAIGVMTAGASAQVTNDPGNDENVEARVEEAVIPKLSLYPADDGLYKAEQRLKRQLKEGIGLDIGVESTTIYQIASGVRPANQAIETTTALFGQWTLWQHENKIDRLGFGFAAENRSNYSGPTFIDMQGDLGTIWSPNDATSDDYTKITQLWWGQKLLDGKVSYIVGLIDAGAYLNGNRFAGSGNTQFFSQPFATNPARAFPDNGLGLVARYAPFPWLQLQGEVSNGDAISTHSPFTSIDGNWFEAGELVLIPQVPGLGEGRYRFMIFQRDSNAGTSCGWALSFDQNLGTDFGAFFRYGNND